MVFWYVFVCVQHLCRHRCRHKKKAEKIMLKEKKKILFMKLRNRRKPKVGFLTSFFWRCSSCGLLSQFVFCPVRLMRQSIVKKWKLPRKNHSLIHRLAQRNNHKNIPAWRLQWKIAERNIAAAAAFFLFEPAYSLTMAFPYKYIQYIYTHTYIYIRCLQ